MGAPGISIRITRTQRLSRPSSSTCRWAQRSTRRRWSDSALGAWLNGGRLRIFGQAGRGFFGRRQRQNRVFEVFSDATVAILPLISAAPARRALVIIIQDFKAARVCGAHDFLDGVAVRRAALGEAKFDGGLVPRVEFVKAPGLLERAARAASKR